jgi:ParB-like chromosome segregation protein Spo0J
MFHSGAAAFHNDLSGLMMPIDDVHQHPLNYNTGDVDKIAESIEVNGVYRPIYVQRSTHAIIAGNHTWEALKLMGAEEVPVILLDVDDTAAKKIMLADNRIASLAMPDNGLLLTLLEDLAADDSIVGTGYEPHDVEVLENLAKIPLEHDEFGQWPTLTFQVPPHIRSAFYEMTAEATGDRERFELLLRLAGWGE